MTQVLHNITRAHTLTRASAYSYTCNGCGRCCYDKRIHVNPYEIARIAEHFGTSTTEVIRMRVDVDSTLAVQADGACTFLEDGSCTIHADRPLACRLYPLGRVVLHDETELFVEVVPHPSSAGVYGDSGTVASYIAQQDVAPYIAAAREYRVILSEWAARLSSEGDVTDFSHADGVAAVPDVLDMDRAVASWSAMNGIEFCGEAASRPLDERVRIHVAWLRAMIQVVGCDDVGSA